MKQLYHNIPIKIRELIPTVVMLLLMGTLFSVATDNFFSYKNLINVLLQTTTMALIGIGLSFVLIGGNFDLSGGSTIALVGVICALLLKREMPTIVVILAGFAVGASIGLFNGLCVTKLRLAPFIITLATSTMASGAALAITNGSTIYGLPERFTWFGAGRLGTVPVAVIIMFLMYFLFYVVLSKTVFGHQVYAIGGNKEAAKLAGISVDMVTISTYILAGCMAATAGIILTGRLGSAVATAGSGMEMNALSGLVIGGISMSGGRGNLIGAFLGCMIIGILTNGLNLLNVSPFYNDLVRGLVIFLAITFDAIRVQLKKR